MPRADDEKETFRHDFARTPEEEQAAKQKGIELLRNSPYKEQSGATQLFFTSSQEAVEGDPQSYQSAPG
jgi:hypothetical protein